MGERTVRAKLRVLWLQAAGCGGCTMSALGAEPAGLVDAFERAGIQFLWHPALSAEGGGAALKILGDCRSGEREFDVLCVEGAVLLGPGGSGGFHRLSGSGEAMAAWIAGLAARAGTVMAVGSCAAWGAVAASGANDTEATGLQFRGDERGGLLGEDWRSAGGLPVVNISGCPPHPGWLVETLMALSLGELTAGELDVFGRPRFWANHLAHHGCARNEYYEFKASAAQASHLGCLMENLGCKATQAPGDCNLRSWNGNGSCTNAGYACINCTSPGFEEPLGAFLETSKVAGIPVGLPVDMPKAWFVALSALSKSAMPERVRRNSREDQVVVPPRRRPPS
ncbi:MAG TPA: HupU protein [Rhodospirillaceae bacterium]|nr:HupU protein [Rhodospirillaceae bacterium]